MRFRVNWKGFYKRGEQQFHIRDFADVTADSAIEALNATRSSIIDKLCVGQVYKLSEVQLHLLEGEEIGLVSMDAINDFIQTFNAEGGTDSTKRIREKGYTVTLKPDGTTHIQTGNKLG